MDEVSENKEWEDRKFDLWQKLKPEPTSVLLDLLSDEEILTRRVAAMELHMRGERAAFDRALELRGSEREEFRETAAFVLSQLGTPDFPYKAESVPILEEMLLEDPSAEVRGTAAAGLGHLKATTSLQSLIKMAADPSPDVRGMVAFALALLELPEAIPTLKALLEDPDDDVMEWADWSLELIVSHSLEAEPTASLLELLEDEDDYTSRGAACQLGDRSDAGEAAFARALELRKSKRKDLRRTAVFVLEELGCGWESPFKARCVPILEKMLVGDPSPAVRASAAGALGGMGATSALHNLVKMLGDRSPVVRRSVAWAVARLHLAEARPTLEALLDDPDKKVAGWAKWGLEQLGHAES